MVRSQRGSTTIMAITAMMVLTVGAATYTYMTNRNITIAQNYAAGLQAQYTAEAAVRLMYVAGRESIKPANGWTSPQPSALDNWAGRSYSITLPMGITEVAVDVVPGETNLYRVQADAATQGVSRIAYNSQMSITNKETRLPPTLDDSNEVTTARLISQGRDSGVAWKLPDNLDDTTRPAVSPGSDNGSWRGLFTQVLFNDSLGLPDFKATAELQTLFRINYFIRLTQYPTDGSGTGYGIYYLAQKFFIPPAPQEQAGHWDTGNPKNPLAYVVQFDPGITDWDGGRTPAGTFLVKKVMPRYDANDANNQVANGPAEGPVPAQAYVYETWDESGSYNFQRGFQNNIDLTQQYYNSRWRTIALGDDYNASREPTNIGPGLLSGNYISDPGNLRLAYALGSIAEGNPWKAGTRYAKDARVMANPGMLASNPDNRLVYVAQNEGRSGSTPLPVNPTAGQNYSDGEITWKVQKVRTAAEIAQYVVAKGISIVKISMADLKFRIDSVNGTVSRRDPFEIPFDMKTKNKITIEMVVDNQGNRVHIIRVNDVLALAFNDVWRDPVNTYEKNIIPQGWELDRTLPYQYRNSTSKRDLRKVVATSQLGTGLRVWNAVAEFYTAENYGQTVQVIYTTSASFGVWGR